MTTILPKSQEWFDFKDASNTVVGAHTIKTVSTSDTFRVPALAEAHATASVKQLERAGDSTVTVAASDADSDGSFETITVTAPVGTEALILTIHQGGMNFAEDEDS